MRVIKADIFLQTGKAKCPRHGEHSKWIVYTQKHKQKNGEIKSFKALRCVGCSRDRKVEYRKNNPRAVDDYRFGFNGTLALMIYGAKRRAKKNRLPIEVDIEWVKLKLIEQDYRCAYSGIKFDFTTRPKSFNEKRYYIPSIDQKFPGVGYTKENSMLIASIVNVMKFDIGLEEFLTICKKISDKNK